MVLLFCIVVVVAVVVCLLLFLLILTNNAVVVWCSGSLCVNSLLSRFFFPPFRTTHPPCLLAHRLPSMSPWRPKQKQKNFKQKLPTKHKQKVSSSSSPPSRHCFFWCLFPAHLIITWFSSSAAYWPFEFWTFSFFRFFFLFVFCFFPPLSHSLSFMFFVHVTSFGSVLSGGFQGEGVRRWGRGVSENESMWKRYKAAFIWKTNKQKKDWDFYGKQMFFLEKKNVAKWFPFSVFSYILVFGFFFFMSVFVFLFFFLI